ncbi:MAG: hypothetical protein KI785_00770 [Devosiaceae bacterium]|nr:hypothetical protein [Devosiaceae bacterium MH13]
MSKNQGLALKAAAILWVIWGLVHMLAGVIIIPADASGGFAAVADAVDPALLVHDYHPAVNGILDQHGWNLLWIGLTTVISAFFIWRANFTAVWVAALVGGLADVGYFIFVDLPGFVHFVPGTLMTLVSSSAIILSFAVWLPTEMAKRRAAQ